MKVLKLILLYISTTLLVGILLYIGIAFVKYETDLSKFPEGARAFIAFMSMFSGLLVIPIVVIEEGV